LLGAEGPFVPVLFVLALLLTLVLEENDAEGIVVFLKGFLDTLSKEKLVGILKLT